MSIERLPPVLSKRQFAIITARNPNNRELTLAENRLRNNRLEEMIKLRADSYYPSGDFLNTAFPRSRSDGLVSAYKPAE
jgi:hypothetical protein